MQGYLSMEIQTTQESRHLLAIEAAEATPGAGAVTRAEFLRRIDFCVRHLAALLAGLEPASAEGEPPTVERARVQLWHWLHAGNTFLDDGTPIDFALFDAAIQTVGERLPRRGLPGQENILRAACLLAELTHARSLAEPAPVSALVRQP
jgi:malate synthase